jgi:hypothetical protein
MERMSSTGDRGEKDLSQKQDTLRKGSDRTQSDRVESAPRPRMVRLPGEVLQVQMQN